MMRMLFASSGLIVGSVTFVICVFAIAICFPLIALTVLLVDLAGIDIETNLDFDGDMPGPPRPF